MNGIRMSVVIAAGIFLRLGPGALAADEPAVKKVFADEQWYRAAEGREQVFAGRLRKEQSPMATSGRWNPVRLVIDAQTTWEVYLGSHTGMLDAYVGHAVRITGKPQTVLGHKEIWPARIQRGAPGPDEQSSTTPQPAAPPDQ